MINLDPHTFIAGFLGLSLVDFVTLVRSRNVRRKKTFNYSEDAFDFTILVPIFGDMKYLKNVEYLKQYGDKVVLCTTTFESFEFEIAIEKVAQENNFRIFRSLVPRATKKSKANPWHLFFNTLSTKSDEYVDNQVARDEIARDSLKIVKTKYCIFIDGDTTTPESMPRLVGEMIEKDFDLSSVRVLVANQETLIGKLQGFEYELAMEARFLYPWLTSGAGMIAKTDVMKHIMSNHSLFFSGGDIEIGKLASILGYKVGHIPFVFLTDAPDTLKKWFKQRMLWFGGGFRHTIVNIHKFTWKNPYIFFYTTVMVYLSLPVKWYELVRFPVGILYLIPIYWIWLFIFHFKRFKPFLLLYPIYSFTQAMIVLPFGVYAYAKMASQSKNLGFIKIRNRI